MEKIIVLDFTESKKTKKPIARTEAGKMCILDFNCMESKIVNPGETWNCRILCEDENKLIVKPLSIKLSKEQNKAIFDSKLQELKSKFSTT